MSGAMENRAAVFTSSPQEVEVYRAGSWEPGSMLGWRHEPDGSCRAWVRLAGDVAEETWADLADVRLPEPPALRSVPGGGADAPAGAGVTPGGRLPAEPAPTTSLHAVRGGAGRPAPAATTRPGGRRRAPETAESGAAAYWAALDAVGNRVPDSASPPGRHRAPAVAGPGAGRHRAADTEVMPAVTADGTVAAERAPRAEAGQPTAPFALPAAAGADGVAGDEPDLYTRPLRLAPSIPQPRSGGRPGPRGGR